MYQVNITLKTSIFDTFRVAFTEAMCSCSFRGLLPLATAEYYTSLLSKSPPIPTSEHFAQSNRQHLSLHYINTSDPEPMEVTHTHAVTRLHMFYTDDVVLQTRNCFKCFSLTFILIQVDCSLQLFQNG